MKKPKPLHWQAYEYEHIERSPDWFWAVGIISVAIAITAIIFNNVLFAILVLLAAFTLSLYASREPELMDIVLDEKGVHIDKYFYPYAHLESFWIDESGKASKILLKSQKLIMPYIVVPIDEIDPEKVRTFLRFELPEVPHSEPALQKMLEYLGF